MASMNNFDSDMSYITNTVVDFDKKSGNLCLRLWSRSHTIYVTQVDSFIFHPANWEQTIAHQHVLLRWEGLSDGTR
jgi:hypothetical protein